MINKNYYDFCKDKSVLLKAERGISFQEIIIAMENDGLIDTINHPNTNKYIHQKMFVVALNNYIYLVPFVKKENGVFLKTIFPSRKATKQYSEGHTNETT